MHIPEENKQSVPEAPKCCAESLWRQLEPPSWGSCASLPPAPRGGDAMSPCGEGRVGLRSGEGQISELGFSDSS